MSRKVKWRILSKKFDRFRDPRTGQNRLYVVWLDRNNMEPTGQIERAFTAPLECFIPDSYMSFPADKPWRVDLDLDGYARYLKKALMEWELRYKEIRDTRPKGEDDARIMELAGPKPQDWRLIVLMSRGDPWCLGFQNERTPAVESIIGKAPTARDIARERLIPKDLRLDPALERLVAGGVQEQFPDELDDERIRMAGEDLQRISHEELAQANIDPDEVEDGRAGPDDDDEELTGELDLDDADLDADIDLEKALEFEEAADPKALGGKKQNPAKNKTKPKE
jgi:hypothetical protein